MEQGVTVARVLFSWRVSTLRLRHVRSVRRCDRGFPVASFDGPVDLAGWLLVLSVFPCHVVDFVAVSARDDGSTDFVVVGLVVRVFRVLAPVTCLA